MIEIGFLIKVRQFFSQEEPSFQKISLLLVLTLKMQGKKQVERFLVWFLIVFLSCTVNNHIIQTEDEV